LLDNKDDYINDVPVILNCFR